MVGFQWLSISIAPLRASRDGCEDDYWTYHQTLSKNIKTELWETTPQRIKFESRLSQQATLHRDYVHFMSTFYLSTLLFSYEEQILSVLHFV